MTIVADNLEALRGGHPVLAGVSFSLKPGDCLLLRGANGAGKTTLLRRLAGLGQSGAGRLLIDAESVAYAGHLDAVKGQLSVAENLRFWAAIHDGPAPAQVLARFSLEALADRPAAELSAGQRRRLGLARLALTGRGIWLLDEPTTALDTANVALVEQMITEHCAGGGIAVIATHLPLDIPGARTLLLDDLRAIADVQDADPFLEDLH